MTISYQWLLEYLPEPLPIRDLSQILTSIGLEVEGIDTIEAVKGSLKGLVIGEVLSCEKHPNADKLKVTKVNIGTSEPLNIVCGAPNVAAGQKVVVAPVGTTVHPLKGEAFQINKAKIRGESSEGMICAEDEIGLGESHAGIIILPETAVVGTLAKDHYKIPVADHAIHIGLTPNRSDAMSHIGVAKDVCAYITHHRKPAAVVVPQFTVPGITSPKAAINVHIEAAVACPRYAGISISNIKIGPSPDWLQKRLHTIGLRPINNVVDITNFVLHEYGQPLHAFDADTIKGNAIHVRFLPDGSSFTTLDEKVKKLRSSDLMICDADEGMCIAGVFGGLHSGVTSNTKNIFLESAYFEPRHIRSTSLHHGLRTDAATHFEKDKLGEVLEIIQSDECFYVDANRKIYAAIRRLFDKGMPVDLLTVTEELRKSNELEIVGGAYYLTRLTMSVVSSAHVEAHSRIVMEKFIQRELIRISGQVIGDAYEDSTDVFDLLDKAESGLYEITDKHLRKNFKSLKDVLVKTVHEIEDAKNKKDDLTGVPAGYTALDRLTSGWQRTDLIILAARPSVGKTAFALNLAMNAALNTSKPYPVALFSLEMGAGQIVKRMLSCVTEVSMDAITKGRMQEHEFVQMTQRMNKLAAAPIFLDDQAALNIFELRAKSRRLKQRHDIQLIIIDYLQLMQGNTDKGGNREQEISKISRDLKALAKELEIPIIALSQLNRSVESRKESKVPQLSDLRESGAIEQDADMVMFLYRPEYYGINNDEMGNAMEGETHIHVAKHRNGSTDTVKVRFIKEFQKFIDLPENDFGGGNFAGGFNPKTDNPQTGIRRDTSEFGGSKLYIPGGGFQTKQSKANDMNWDDDEQAGAAKRNTGPDEDTPF